MNYTSRGNLHIRWITLAAFLLMDLIYSLFFSADFLEEHRRVLESRLSPVVREITDSRARNRDELEGMYYSQSTFLFKLSALLK